MEECWPLLDAVHEDCATTCKMAEAEHAFHTASLIKRGKGQQPQQQRTDPHSCQYIHLRKLDHRAKLSLVKNRLSETVRLPLPTY